MKGIILAGGEGTRLMPLTRITNKHLLPVYDKPMIYYSIELLRKSGILDIMLVAGGRHAGEFLRLLGNGRELGINQLNYSYQEKALGIAHALSLCEDFVGKDKFVVYLADNILEYEISAIVQRFVAQQRGAKILLTSVENPSAYGVPVFEDGKVVTIEEKPANPKSNLAVTGVYMLDAQVFDVIRGLKPSERGELEITDVINWYLARGQLEYELLEGFWTDCGESIDSWLQANNRVCHSGANKDAQ